MTTRFQPAQKVAARLRLALVGPAGSGKTYTALTVASELGDNVALIDTEHGSASKYADLFAFAVVNLDPPYEPERYIELIDEAATAGFDVLIVDSLSHAWNGSGGVLEIVDDVVERQSKERRGGGSFAAWREATPRHRALIDAIVAAPVHIIATMRSKVRYAMEKGDNNRTEVVALGVEAVQREGVEYEFDVVGMLSRDVVLDVVKSRCPTLAGRQFPQPGVEFADLLRAWLDGAPDEMAAVADALCRAFADATDEDAFKACQKAARAARDNGDLRGSHLQRVIRAQEQARGRLGIAKGGNGQRQREEPHSDGRVVRRLMASATRLLSDGPTAETLAAWEAQVQAAIEAGDIRRDGTAIESLEAKRAELQTKLDDQLGSEVGPSELAEQAEEVAE